MRIVNGKVKFETRKCHSCNNGRIIPRVPCELDRKPQRGKPCRLCGSKTKEHNYVEAPERDCYWCNGVGQRMETETDSLPNEEWQKLEFRVIRQDRKMGILEQTLGYGVYTCGDYGRAWRANDDDALIREVKDSGRHQVCKILKDGKLCDYVGIFLAPSGYSVYGVFNEEPEIV